MRVLQGGFSPPLESFDIEEVGLHPEWIAKPPYKGALKYVGDLQRGSLINVLGYDEWTRRKRHLRRYEMKLAVHKIVVSVQTMARQI